MDEYTCRKGKFYVDDLPTTVGMMAKKPPFAMPQMRTKATSGPSEVESGQRDNMDSPDTSRVRNNELIGPRISPAKPKPILPKADERLNPARRAALVPFEKPRFEP